MTGLFSFLVLDAGRDSDQNRGIVRMKAARNSASQRGRIALVIGASGHSANNSARGPSTDNAVS